MHRRRRTEPQRQRRRQGAGWRLAAVGAAGVLMLAAVAWLAWPRATAAIEVRGAPRLTVDRDLVDLGPVPLGREAQVTYQLTNVGDQVLVLTRAPFVEVVEGC